MTKPDCYKCKYLQQVPGDVPLSCHHPIFESGWFSHPTDFNPIQILKCDGFLSKEETK